ncbi:MAG: hypothetical protein JSR17_09770 [Proteobacteria bacterium]|nr:hypothetical protein [Pseudomonadota bacterium]
MKPGGIQEQPDPQLEAARRRARLHLVMWAQNVLQARQAAQAPVPAPAQAPDMKVEKPILKQTKPE